MYKNVDESNSVDSEVYGDFKLKITISHFTYATQVTWCENLPLLPWQLYQCTCVRLTDIGMKQKLIKIVDISVIYF